MGEWPQKVTFPTRNDCEIDLVAGILKAPYHEGTLDLFWDLAPYVCAVAADNACDAAQAYGVSVPGCKL